MTRGAAGALALLVGLAPAGGASTPGYAAVPSPEERREDIGEELERLREEVDEAVAEEAGVLAELEVTRRVRAELGDTVADLEVGVAGVEADLVAAEGVLGKAEDTRADAERRLRTARVALARSEEVIEDQAVSRFMRNGAEATALDVFLQVRDVHHLHEATAFVGAVARSQADVVRQHQALERSTAELAARAEAARLDALGRRDEVADRKQALEAARAEQAAALSQAAVEEEREEELLADVQETRADHEERIEALRAESQSITALLSARQASQTVTPGEAASWPILWPTRW